MEEKEGVDGTWSHEIHVSMSEGEGGEIGVVAGRCEQG
jgi:hypothetical protein